MPTNTTDILAYILGALVLILLIAVVRQEMRLKKILYGKNAKTLEDSFGNMGASLNTLKAKTEQIEKTLIRIEAELKRTVKGVSTVRFNPFKGTSGSNQSFATAFLDKEGNGVVLSSLYSRDRVSIFAKPLKTASSEYELTDEEKQAVEAARIK